MIRALLVGTLVVLALVGLAALGGALRTGSRPQDAADAQATNVRRTVVAEAQRIIANAPTPTPTVAATAIPRPSCAANAIWWHEAHLHLGEVQTVQGTIVATRPAPNNAMLLEIGQMYPDPTGLAVVVPFALGTGLDSKTVCAMGRIENGEGRATIQVRLPVNLKILN